MDPITQAYVQLLLQDQGAQIGGMASPFNNLGMLPPQSFDPYAIDAQIGPSMNQTMPQINYVPREPQYSQSRTSANLYRQSDSGPVIGDDPIMAMMPPPTQPQAIPEQPQDFMSMQMQQQRMPGAQGQYQQLLSGEPMNMMGDALSQNFNMQNERKSQMMDTLNQNGGI